MESGRKQEKKERNVDGEASVHSLSLTLPSFALSKSGSTSFEFFFSEEKENFLLLVRV